MAVTNLPQFNRFMRSQSDLGEQVLEDSVMRIAAELYEEVRRRSPVAPIDGGNYRDNWFVAVGEVPEGVDNGKGPNEVFGSLSGESTIKVLRKVGYLPSGRKRVLRTAFRTIWVYNNVPYALRLENGWSQQAPNGVMRLAMIDVDSRIGEILG